MQFVDLKVRASRQGTSNRTTVSVSHSPSGRAGGRYGMGAPEFGGQDW